MKVLLAALLFSLNSLAQSAAPPLNKMAPEVELSQLLHAPGNAKQSLASLRGKAVVLEFWATWCGGCIVAMPHLNQLAEQVRDKPVVFLSVTDESPDVVRRFLEKRPISGWIGIDKDGATFAKYGIEGRPQTFLIDPQGILRLTTEPERVNATLIDDLISKKSLATDAELNRQPVLPMELVKGVPPPLLQVMIRPAAAPAISGNAPGRVTRADGGRIEYYGVTLRTLLSYTEHMRGDRIVAPPWFDQNLYDASTAVPAGRDDVRNTILEQALTASFSLKMQRESKPTDVYVLSGTDGSKMHSSIAKSSPGFSTHPGEFTGVATSIVRLTHLLESNLEGVEVVDETGLTGLYDFNLLWKKGDFESLQTSLRNNLGLTVRKELRNRQFLAVQAVEPATW